jgi:Holliday junction resolvase RusA-like endonuclease
MIENKGQGMLEITIHMRPVAKARPRFGNGRCYTDPKTAAAEHAIAWAVKAQMQKQGISIIDKPVSMYLEFGFALPKNLSKHEKELMQNNQLHHIKKPDLDNVVKLVADSLNGVAYTDDRLIVHIDAYKVYGETDYITIKIEEI